MARGVYYRSPERIAELKRQVLAIPKATGRVHTKESRLKMSLAQMGNKNAKGKKKPVGFGEKISKYMKGRPSHLKGKKLTLEQRIKRSEAQKRLVREGRHPFWRGGINKENLKIRGSIEYRLWRESVFERDKYTCVFCSKVGGKLNADHIKPFSLFPELRFAIDNGRTLCVECHRKTPTWGIGASRYKK